MTTSSDRLHVAHVVLSLDTGGLERIVVDLARASREQGQRVSVICLERPGVLAEQAKASGASVYCAEKRPGLRPSAFVKLYRLLRSLRPDVVHTHQITALFYAGPAARLAGAPLVVHTEHGKHYSASRRTRTLGRWSARFAAAYCCVSRDIANEVGALRIVPDEKVRVIANGIDTAAFAEPGDVAKLRSELGLPHDAPIIGTIGRLAEIKRQDVLIEAFAEVKKQVPKAHLLLVGGGPRLDELRQLSERLGLASSVHLVGHQERPQRFLQLMDIFALTSRSEGMPLSVLEAWAAGVPVLASRVGGVPELVEHGRTGLLFESGDVPALAGLLQQLLGDRALAQRLSQAGLEHVHARHTLDHMARQYEQCYRELLPGTNPAVVFPEAQPCASWR